ncbi:uncharacterized protein DS421_3g82970 [Arachis hypogaea]|nr:uncharacterized protein DS421_3g82970 [Arachis hypogaea]
MNQSMIPTSFMTINSSSNNRISTGIIFPYPAYRYQGGGGGSTSTFYAAPLAFSGPSSENEGDEINDANLQQIMEDFDG